MSECSSSTGVVANTSRYCAAPSNALIAPPTPKKWLWIPNAIASGWLPRASGQPVRKWTSWSTISQSRRTGVTDAECTYWKCTLSGPFSSGICGCTGSPAYLIDSSGYGR